jgi:CHAT domain-containing protein/Tfp pilus assembly protein PilF
MRKWGDGEIPLTHETINLRNTQERREVKIMRVAGVNSFGWLLKSACHAFGICFFVLFLVHPSTLTPQPSEEAEIKKVVEQMFTAFAKEDLDGVMACWAEKSPQFAEFKQFAQNDFVTADDTQFVNVMFTHWKIEAEKATVRLRFDWKWSDVKTKKPAQQATVWNVQFVKEADGWKWWQPSDAINDLSNELLLAKTKEEREKKLNDEKELVTARLVSTLRNASGTQAKQGNFAFALKLSDLAFEVAETLGDKASLGWCWMRRGLLFHYQSQYPAALENYQRALPLFREAKDKQGEAETLNNIGVVYDSTGRYALALAQYEASLNLAKEIGDKGVEAKTLGNIGNVYQLMGNYAEALAQYEASLKIERELGSKTGEAETLSNIGVVYQSMGKYALALAQYEASLNLAKEIGDKGVEAKTLGNIGNVYQSTGKYAEALGAFEASLKINQEIGDRAEEATTLIGIGIVYQSVGKYALALAQYEANLKVLRELGMKAEEAGTLNTIGSVYQLTGKYALALAQYEASLNLAKEIGDKEVEAMALGNIGIVYDSTGKYAEALAQYEASLKIEQEIGDRAGEAGTLNNIGIVYRSTGKYAEALAQYEASLKIEQEIGDRAGEAGTLNNIGVVYRLTGKYAEALAQFEAALKISEPIGDIDTALHSYRSIGEVHQAQQQWESASEAYRKAITLIEQVRAAAKEPSLQMGFFEQYTSPYYGLVTSLLARNHVEEAFQTAERAKARTLVEILQGGRVDITKAMTAEEKRREQELNERIALANLELRTLQSQSNPNQSKLSDVKSRLFAARQDSDAFRIRLYHAHPELQAQRGAFSPLTVAQAAQFILAQQAHDLLVLEYIVGDDQTWLFALNGTGQLAVYPIKMTHKELSQRVNALREAIRLREADKLGALPQIEAALRQLDSLLEPLSNVLAGARQVCIVPDDVLWEVPFAALKTQEGKYLVETHAVFYAPSLTALKAEVEAGKKQQQTPQSQLLAMAPFAYPDSENSQRTREMPLRGTFGALPKSESEVTAVSALFDTKPYLREAATEHRAKTEASRVRLLHFATHGVFEPLQGMYSGVLLAEEKGGGSIGSEGAGEDGYLEAREIVELDLKASLAVLSACETARGQLSRGEGVLGLSWAFFVAGCPSTVVSQWKVADESTAELMKAFYLQLCKGTSKDVALQKAMATVRSNPKWRHPFYWASFLLVGDWQ